MTPIRRKLLITLLSAASAVVIFAVGFAFGNRNLALRQGVVPILIDRQIGKPADVNFGLFWKAYQQIQDRYAGGEIDPQEQLYGAIRGMVAALGDPYSLFLTPTEREDFFTSLNGTLEGIGAEVGRRDGAFVVIAPLDGSPAERAGLEAGDQIIAVDGEDILDSSLEAVIHRIRGPKGTTVTLQILRAGETSEREVSIVRDTISVPSVKSSVRDDGIGVIRISQFGETTGDDARAAAERLKEQSVTGVVLDLRRNPGGFLEGAVDVASLWIEQGPIVAEQDRNDHRDTFDATGDAVLAGIPLAVLVDNGSASASEIVAGAIQDRGAGRVFGVTTFGKGSVQDIQELEDSSALRLTVATWLTPKGRSINHEGITPDEVVETPKDSGTTKADPVLDAALAWLKTQVTR